jgi:hypothetical protein
MTVPKTTAPERRKNTRKRVLLRGLVCDPAGAPKYTCAIREVTPSGARITLPMGRKAFPEICLVHVREKVAYDAILLWHNTVEAGYALLSDIPLSPNGDERARQMLGLCGASSAA